MKKTPATKKPDLLDDIVETRTKKNPKFPEMVKTASKRRRRPQVRVMVLGTPVDYLNFVSDKVLELLFRVAKLCPHQALVVLLGLVRAAGVRDKKLRDLIVAAFTEIRDEMVAMDKPKTKSKAKGKQQDGLGTVCSWGG